jgi:hypothetical protein
MKINDLPFDENLIGRKFLSLSGNGKILEIYKIVPEYSITYWDKERKMIRGPRFDLICVRHFDTPDDGYDMSFYYLNADQELLEELERPFEIVDFVYNPNN